MSQHHLPNQGRYRCFGNQASLNDSRNKRQHFVRSQAGFTKALATRHVSLKSSPSTIMVDPHHGSDAPHVAGIPHALLAINQAFLLFSFRFVTPSVRMSVAVAFPFIGCPLTRTSGAAAESTPRFANASSLCSSAYSASSLSLRSSSATLRNTKR